MKKKKESQAVSSCCRKHSNIPSTTGMCVGENKQGRKRAELSSSHDTDSIELQESSDDDMTKQLPESSDNDVPCMFCQGNYAEDHHGQIWIQFILFTQCALEECSDALTENYVCDFCK